MKEIIKYVFLYVYKKTYNFLYLFTKLKKIDEKKVIIVISRANKLEGNLKFIHDELLRKSPKLKIHFVFAENKMNLKLLKELLIISDAKYIILDDYYLPVYLLKMRKRVKIIQVWHAAGAFKKFGYSTVGTPFGPSETYLNIVPIHSNYTHVYVSSEHVKPYYAEAFNMKEKKIHALGIPRADAIKSLNSSDSDNLRKELNIHNRSSKVILFAPTYRAKGLYAESSVDMVEVLKHILERISKETIIIYKPHPYSTDEMSVLSSYKNFIVEKNKDINTLMLIADALITDYSSVVFEYSLLERPLAHFVPDLKEYEDNRGFYEPIQVISNGVIIEELEELVFWIESRKKNELFDTEKMISYNFINLNSSTEKIVTHFLNEN